MFGFSTIISKIQASKLPTVPESQAPGGLNAAIEFGLFQNSPLSIGAWDSGTVCSLEACIFEIIVLN
jgi:hypothetical protein